MTLWFFLVGGKTVRSRWQSIFGNSYFGVNTGKLTSRWIHSFWVPFKRNSTWTQLLWLTWTHPILTCTHVNFQHECISSLKNLPPASIHCNFSLSLFHAISSPLRNPSLRWSEHLAMYAKKKSRGGVAKTKIWTPVPKKSDWLALMTHVYRRRGGCAIASSFFRDSLLLR